MRKQPTQARGRQRVDRILQAAAEEFAEAGFDAATTNSIAARAETSIGSVYQFFGDKEAILDALADRYLAELAAVHGSVPAPGPDTTLEEILDPLVQGLIAYGRANPAFLTLLGASAAGGPGAAGERIRAVVRANTLRALVNKPLPPDQTETMATVCTEILRVLLPTAAATPAGPEADRLALHLKAALAGYLHAIEAALRGGQPGQRG